LEKSIANKKTLIEPHIDVLGEDEEEEVKNEKR
jgi:hypothetical protein